jgi:hypothetical protein
LPSAEKLLPKMALPRNSKWTLPHISACLPKLSAPEIFARIAP